MRCAYPPFIVRFYIFQAGFLAFFRQKYPTINRLTAASAPSRNLGSATCKEVFSSLSLNFTNTPNSGDLTLMHARFFTNLAARVAAWG